MNKQKKRDIGMEILEGIQAIKRGEGVKSKILGVEDIKRIREKMHLSQTAFAGFLNVSVRTVQDWEQGRRTPRGPAQSLLFLAQQRPDILMDVFVNSQI